MEKQILKKNRLGVTAITSAIPFSIEKSFVHKTKKDQSKIEKSEQIPITIDYTKLHVCVCVCVCVCVYTQIMYKYI